jgi:DNA-binding HxlR family transcriptional regulator
VKQGRRNYSQYCGLAGGLDIIGERWTLLIVRELLTGPCRYNELLANLPGIGTNLLAERLKFLSEAGVIRQVAKEGAKEGAKVKAYELTEEGRELRSVILPLARWGLGRLGAPGSEDVVRPRWAALAVEAMIDEERAETEEEYEFRIDDEVFHVQISQGKAMVRMGPAAGEPALVATTDALTFVEIGAGRLNPLSATLTRRLTMEGDEGAILRCTRLLGLVS